MRNDASSFAEIAVALLEVARNEAINVAGCEVLLAKIETEQAIIGRQIAPGMADAFKGLSRRAELIGQAHDLFKLLADHEAEVRRIVARASVRAVPRSETA